MPVTAPDIQYFSDSSGRKVYLPPPTYGAFVSQMAGINAARAREDSAESRENAHLFGTVGAGTALLGAGLTIAGLGAIYALARHTADKRAFS